MKINNNDKQPLLPNAHGSESAGTVTPLVRWAHAAGIIPSTVFYGFKLLYTQYFMLEIVGLSGYDLAIILTVAGVAGACFYPIFAQYADHCDYHPLYGRRRIWILGVTLPFCGVYALKWWVPSFLSDGALLAYYCVTFLVFELSNVVYFLSYDTLTMELTTAFHERTSLQYAKGILAGIFGLVALILLPVLISLFSDEQQGYWVLNLGVACLMVPVMVFSTLAVSERKENVFDSKHTARMPLGAAIRVMLSNRNFLRLIGASICFESVVTILAGNLVLYLEFVLKADDSIVLVVIGIYFVVCLLGLKVFEFISYRLGKKETFILLLFLTAVGCIPVFWLQGEDDVWFFLALVVLIGLGNFGGTMMHKSMLADTMDDDEITMGYRREGAFVALRGVLLYALGASIGAAVNSALDSQGFISEGDYSDYTESRPKRDQPDGVILTLRVICSFVPAAMMLLAFFAIRNYDLSKDKVEANRLTLAQKAQQPALPQ